MEQRRMTAKAKTPTRIRGVLLDVDGTLIDSNDAHARAWVDALDEFGYDIPFERVRPLIGMGGDKLLPALIGIAKDSDEGERLSKRRTEIFFTRYLPTIQPFPQVRELVQRMRRDGLELAVATSAEGEELEKLIRAAGVTDLIEETATSSDAASSKPDPGVIHAALERSGKPPREVLLLGDTPYDIEAATAAKVRVIALRCGGWWSDTDLAGALAIYDDPADLLAHYEDSPLHPRVADAGASDADHRTVDGRARRGKRTESDSRAS
jgi:phosphoglycolate phosphatase-like HAD superfamily hydrolase